MVSMNYVSTASYCVENYLELGSITAAILLDKIVRLSKTTTRKDGFCWYTHKQFEEETGIGKKAFYTATKLLEDKGVIEKKVTYIVGTMTKATHFKLSHGKTQKGKSEVLPRNQSRFTPEEPISEYNKYTINSQISPKSSADADFALDESYSSANADSSNSSNVEASSSGSSFIKDKKEEMPFPFDKSVLGDSREQEWHSASVKPQKKNSKNSQGWAVANEVYKKLGIGVKPSTKFVALVKHQIERGYTSEQILKCLDWCKTNDFYKDINDPMALLCDNAMDQANMKKQNKYGFKDEGGGVSTTDDIVY